MHFPTLKRLAGGLAILSLTAQTVLARPCAEPAMLIFDGSGSMAEAGSAFASASRIRDAQGAVGQVMPEVAPFRDIGLLVYGPGSSDGCDGISLALEPREDMALEIITEVNGIRPDGLTPLAASVEAAAHAMQYQTQPSVLVVVTDGFETCGGNPCEMAKSLSSNSAGLQIHVVGFNLPNESVGYGARVIAQRGARCLAEETGGMYVLTETAEELVSALNMTLGCMLLVGRETELTTLPG